MPKKESPRVGGMLSGRRAQLDAAIDAQTGRRPAMKSTPVKNPIPPRAPPRTNKPKYK